MILRKEPYRMLIISGELNTAMLAEKIQKQEADRFHIQMTIQEENNADVLEALIRMNDVIVLYGVSMENKIRLLYQAIMRGKILYATQDAYVSMFKYSKATKLAGVPFVKISGMNHEKTIKHLYNDLRDRLLSARIYTDKIFGD